jgi:multiple sugar transport system substrate-binding protein
MALALVLVLFVAPLGLSEGQAEGGAAQEQQKVTLDFNTLFHGGDSQAMKRIVDKFNNEHENVQIDLVQGQWNQYYAQLRNAVVAGNAPQLGITHTQFLKQMQAALTPLRSSPAGDLVENAGIEPGNYISDLWDAGEYEGKRYLIPLDTHMWGMWYNPSIFEEAGVDPNSPPDNGEQLEQVANAIVNNTDNYAIHFAEDAAPRKIRRAWFIFYWQMGGELFNEDYTQATFNNEKGVQALQYVVDAVNEKGWNQPGTDGFKQFTAGNLGMLFAGNWFYWTAKEAGVDYSFHYVPQVFDQRKTWGSSHNLIIPKQEDGTSAAVYEAAASAIKWINENSHLWGIYGGHIPAYNPARESEELLSSDTWQKSLKKFAEMAQQGALHYPIDHKQASKLNDAIQAPIEKAYNGTISPQEALDQAEAEVNSILSES